MRTRTPTVMRHIYTAAPAHRTRGCVSAASVCSDFFPRSKSRSAACLHYVVPRYRYSAATGQSGAISQIEHGRRSYAASSFGAVTPPGDAIFHQSSVTAPLCLSAVPGPSGIARPASTGVYTERKTSNRNGFNSGTGQPARPRQIPGSAIRRPFAAGQQPACGTSQRRASTAQPGPGLVAPPSQWPQAGATARLATTR